jgi:hypothetical protein
MQGNYACSRQKPGITLRDLLGEEPPPTILDGATIQPSRFRAKCERFSDSNKPKHRITAGITAVKFWVILDCGEQREDRLRPIYAEYQTWLPREELLRPHRYLPVAVGVDQEIWMVEREEQGQALPGIYLSFDEACEVSSDLSAVCEIHET